VALRWHGAAGARVVVNDLGVSMSGEGGDAGPAQRVVEEIRAAGGEAVASTDSVDLGGANAIVQCALDSFGRIDAVVNNAGNLRDRMFFKMNEEEWRSVIDVHLHGTFFVSRAAANYFKDQKAAPTCI
jgi:NAD(P)-dependent dehydrogenase (short-subunit alcohol dehydrogenase family)